MYFHRVDGGLVSLCISFMPCRLICLRVVFLMKAGSCKTWVLRRPVALQAPDNTTALWRGMHEHLVLHRGVCNCMEHVDSIDHD